MDNYEYITACLPVLNQDDKNMSALDADAVVEEIREQLSDRDKATLQLLLDGYDPGKLGEEFYRKALASGNSFIRGYFRCDLDMRNTRVAFINKAFGRPETQDMVIPDGEEFEPDADTEAALATDNLLDRERALDDITWKKVEELTQMHVFDLDLILGFVVKLKTIERWLKLDPETGHQLFRQLVQEIRNTNIS